MKPDLQELATDARDLHRELSKLLDDSPLSQALLAALQQSSGLKRSALMDRINAVIEMTERLANASERAAKED